MTDIYHTLQNISEIWFILHDIYGVPCKRGRYRYLRGNYSSTTSLLRPPDMHTALAEPSLAGADGILVYEDGGAQPGMPMFSATEAYMQRVLGPVAQALYGS